MANQDGSVEENSTLEEGKREKKTRERGVEGEMARCYRRLMVAP